MTRSMQIKALSVLMVAAVACYSIPAILPEKERQAEKKATYISKQK